MQVETDPVKLVQNTNRGVFQCPACQHEMALVPELLLQPCDCHFCHARILLPRKIGPFWLFRKLGQGGRGSVFQAFHEQHHNLTYAVKIPSRESQDRELCVRSLLHEAQIAHALAPHPGLVSLLASGWDGDECYLAMDYLQGETLSECIARQDGLPEVAVIRLGLQLLDVIEHIVDQGFLYRDLKPENVILNARGQAFLCDFGLTLPLDIAAGFGKRSFEGSPIYVPPERLLMEGEDCTSDIYSLGMVLYHAIAGTPYYTADEVFNVIRQHVSEVRMRTQRIRLTRVPRDFMQVMGRMIRRDPRERYSTFAEVREALKKLLRCRSCDTHITFRHPH